MKTPTKLLNWNCHIEDKAESDHAEDDHINDELSIENYSPPGCVDSSSEEELEKIALDNADCAIDLIDFIGWRNDGRVCSESGKASAS